MRVVYIFEVVERDGNHPCREMDVNTECHSGHHDGCGHDHSGQYDVIFFFFK